MQTTWQLVAGDGEADLQKQLTEWSWEYTLDGKKLKQKDNFDLTG